MINIYTITIINENKVKYYRAKTYEEAMAYAVGEKVHIRKMTYDSKGFCVKYETIKNF